MTQIDREELRQLVRQALRETLGAGAGAASKAPPGLIDDMRAALSRGKPARVPVAVGNAADLDRFAREILHAADHSDLKAAIAAGDICFEPAAGDGRKPKFGGEPPVKRDAGELEAGVLSETRVVELARTGRRILIGRKVVVTPLAREKARQLKVELVRQKP